MRPRRDCGPISGNGSGGWLLAIVHWFPAAGAAARPTELLFGQNEGEVGWKTVKIARHGLVEVICVHLCSSVVPGCTDTTQRGPRAGVVFLSFNRNAHSPKLSYSSTAIFTGWP